MANRATLRLTPEAWQKVQALTQEIGDKEIGGYMLVADWDDGWVLVDDIIVTEQEISWSKVDLTEESHAEAIEIAAGMNRVEDLLGSWHSHGSMGCFWSNDDEKTIKGYGQGGLPFLVSLLVNRKGEAKARLDFFDKLPIAGPIGYWELDIEVVKPANPFVDWAKQSIEDKVATEKWHSNSYSGNGSSPSSSGGLHGPGKGRPSGHSPETPSGKSELRLLEGKNAAEYLDTLPDELDDEEIQKFLDDNGFTILDKDGDAIDVDELSKEQSENLAKELSEIMLGHTAYLDGEKGEYDEWGWY